MRQEVEASGKGEKPQELLTLGAQASCLLAPVFNYRSCRRDKQARCLRSQEPPSEAKRTYLSAAFW
jgi:hypothetical protein